jgi:predicted flap endonuclease-1-like 5' DNA nuclease
MTKLNEIEGIGSAYEEKLIAAGITSLESLLTACTSKKERTELAEKTDIPDILILKWVNRADLARINGIGSEYADLLEAAGVDTVPELARRNAGNLFIKITDVNEEYKFVKKMPTEKQVEDWIEQAKKLPRVIQY